MDRARPIVIDGARLPGGGDPVRIVLDEGRITVVEPAATTSSASGRRPESPSGARRLQADGLWAAPGFVELQVNGAGGRDLTADPEAMWAVGAALAPFGVTSFLPTIVTSPPETIASAQRTLLAGPPEGYRGPAPLGLHLEGPFLNPDRRGAHDAAHLRRPARDVAAGWSPDGGIRIVTLAPELPGAVELIAELAGRGIVVSAGHSMATVDEARAGFDAGVRYATHVFNAMPPLDHRAPGLAAAALADPRVTIGLIADGRHVHPTLVDLVWRVCGPGRLSIVSDAIAALGMPPGHYPLGGADVEVGHDGARLADGRLAGGVLGVDGGIRNLAAYAGCPPEIAILSATRVPARLLGLADRGSLRPGSVADVVLLADDLSVVATIAAGQVAHLVEDARWA